MRLADSLRASYDDTPYRDQFFPEFDLSRLLGLAQLFGVRQLEAPREALRVLDLGCASGVHLREQARRYPTVEFTGIDFARSEIDLGRKAITEEGLSNVELINSDLRTVEIQPGSFDLIVSHGIFSWVPDDVKERLLLLCRQGLRPTGVAAIAYLTYPGWKQREAIRELLMMRTHKKRSPDERVRESALLLRLLHASYSAHEQDVHAQSLKACVESMQKSPTNAFVHDDLGQVHDPCYFLQFAEWAAECGLQYLAESDLGTMSTQGLNESAELLLGELAPDFVETQQLIDFVVNRSGRSSILVRDDATLDRSLSMTLIRNLHFGTSWWNVTPLNADPEAEARFESNDGRGFEVDDPCIRWILSQLTSVPGCTRSHSRLVSDAESKGHRIEEMDHALLSLVAKGIVEPRMIVD
jgi:SAM-dependent methyltransferase